MSRRKNFALSKWLRFLCGEAYGKSCLKCGATENLTLDHIKAVAYGGTDSPDNVQLLCYSCNTGKSSLNLDYRPKNWRLLMSPVVVKNPFYQWVVKNGSPSEKVIYAEKIKRLNARGNQSGKVPKQALECRNCIYRLTLPQFENISVCGNRKLDGFGEETPAEGILELCPRISKKERKRRFVKT